MHYQEFTDEFFEEFTRQIFEEDDIPPATPVQKSPVEGSPVKADESADESKKLTDTKKEYYQQSARKPRNEIQSNTYHDTVIYLTTNEYDIYHHTSEEEYHDISRQRIFDNGEIHFFNIDDYVKNKSMFRALQTARAGSLEVAFDALKIKKRLYDHIKKSKAKSSSNGIRTTLKGILKYRSIYS